MNFIPPSHDCAPSAPQVKLNLTLYRKAVAILSQPDVPIEAADSASIVLDNWIRGFHVPLPVADAVVESHHAMVRQGLAVFVD